MAKDFDISVTMTGLDELEKMLKGLSYETSKKGGRFALRKSAQVLRKAAAQSAFALDDPETARSIAQNASERWSSRYNKQTGDLKFRVGFKGGASTNKKIVDAAGGPTPEWRLIEFGTSTVAANPFFQRAVTSNLQSAANVFISEYKKAIQRRIAKGAV